MIRLFALSLLVFFHQPGFSHRLQLFASYDGTFIQGYAYFTGSSVAAVDAEVAILDAASQELVVTTVTDKTGLFRYKPQQVGNFLLKVKSADGHAAQYTLHLLQQGNDIADTGILSPLDDQSVGRKTSQQDSLSEQDIERLLNRQIAPLQEQLQRLEQRTRLQDILGGLGYIVGIAGFYLWWRRRGEQ